MIITGEIPFFQFKELPHVRGRSLNEQVRYYNDYLEQFIRVTQSVGGGGDNFILQEDNFYILQEDGSLLIQE